jgi:hypothetical protein
MALRLRRGTTAELALLTPLNGELVYDVSTKSLYIGDGTTVGGKLLASGGTILEDIVLNGNDITGTGDIDITGDIEVSGSIHATGNITADGDITLGAGGNDTVSFDAKIDTNLIPETSANVDLGSDSNRWINVYALTVDANTLNGNTFGYHTGDVEGSVFADNSTMLVDGVAGKITGVVETTTVTASAGLFGELTGNVFGNVQGDVVGNVQGNVTGVFVGELRSTSGVVVGNTGNEDFAEIRANVAGDLYGSVFADTTGVGAGSITLIDGTEGTINLNSTINDSIVPLVDAQYDVGSRDANFKDVFLSDRVYFANFLDIQLSEDSANGVAPVVSFKGGSANRIPVSTTISGNLTGTVTGFQVADARGIRPGAIFGILGVTERTVDTVNVGTGAVTVTEGFTASGSTDGLIVTFFNPPEYTATYKFEAPLTAGGIPGDRKGMIYADSTHIYVCVSDYTGVSDIWVRASAGTW